MQAHKHAPCVVGVLAVAPTNGIPEVAKLVVRTVHVRQPQLTLGIACSKEATYTNTHTHTPYRKRKK